MTAPRSISKDPLSQKLCAVILWSVPALSEKIHAHAPRVTIDAMPVIMRLITATTFSFIKSPMTRAKIAAPMAEIVMKMTAR